ncbi:MAG: primosomal protein N' [Planctomycetota bacterium]|nr:primosomal protein N' [Planctomycetota bacterium]
MVPPSLLPADDSTYVAVALDLPVDRLFTYRVPAAQREQAEVGHRVRVPFRGRTLTGFVAALEHGEPEFSVKDVAEAPDDGATLTPDLLRLGAFIARYYGCSLGEALAAMVPRGVRQKGKGRKRTRVQLCSLEAADAFEAAGRASAAAVRVLRRLRTHPEGLLLADLCRAAHVSPSPIHTLVRQGMALLHEEREVTDQLEEAARSAPRTTPHELTPDQRRAVDALAAAVDAEQFGTFLLLGVTGSGKTEVYLQAIDRAVAQGRQAIVLVPEIALTPQTVRRFRGRFDRVAVLHSAMTEAERAAAWRRIRAGEADVVIGPRSAIFAPVPRLGLLVVDEEHEPSFKQQSTPRYHARDVGIVRAQEVGAVVVLGSATPALETYRNACEGRYALLELPVRVGGRALPSVQVVDRGSPDERAFGQGHISRTLEVRIGEALRAEGQVILLQNRRGYATSVACPRCGWLLGCGACDLTLTFHRHDGLARCHLCGHEETLPLACPDCALPRPAMRGVGTQTIEEELGRRFPDARVARMDSDSMLTREHYEDVLGRFEAGDVDILVGTQMIAKGLDFPNVVLVGIISADTALALPDFRSAERTFGLLAQVAGRAGRGDADGRVVIQTLMPGHPAITLAAAQDYAAFARYALEDRETFGYPPFGRLLRVVLRAKDARALDSRARETQGRIVRAATRETHILGPAIPPVPRVQGFHRRHIMVKATDHREIARVLEALRKAPRPKGGVEEIWDVDPLGVI